MFRFNFIYVLDDSVQKQQNHEDWEEESLSGSRCWFVFMSVIMLLVKVSAAFISAASSSSSCSESVTNTAVCPLEAHGNMFHLMTEITENRADDSRSSSHPVLFRFIFTVFSLCCQLLTIKQPEHFTFSPVKCKIYLLVYV